ncbi:2Fe-2S iron-sulfur cluster binding domain-containing protein [Azospirillum sp. RWY-5-1]|uniref:2Fe-2S iron-sulfur cluster binding domain-containing protein n=1 Tax=Azospirillum oleiclasticum TaxID=2735135 RepID=A0ABX2TL67_9PROT|nr:2Fe-2S iron-sulfur cluster-binding protein [Azospirillum oleiclasticum]NYZ17485.1 2Fe-2S iron-sulfur cluster binding domain-containing protein [Azospirillum oleiclasticum]NYZ24864.1 2Fe-2S iron-sulfur cluster binding domain-containing protein [Azospirillum oleiclasticum]
MAKVTFIEHDGAELVVDIPTGWTVMQGAVQNGVAGIEGECGGSCACATCHCYVDEAFLDGLPAPGETEDEMLGCTASERRANSRLSCQIRVTDALDGLVVRLPEAQS